VQVFQALAGYDLEGFLLVQQQLAQVLAQPHAVHEHLGLCFKLLNLLHVKSLVLLAGEKLPGLGGVLALQLDLSEDPRQDVEHLYVFLQD
jgi:hypothetical protein